MIRSSPHFVHCFISITDTYNIRYEKKIFYSTFKESKETLDIGFGFGMMVNMKKKLFIVIHTHRFGTSVGLVKAARKPVEQKACKALGFDYDDAPRRFLVEETVEVFEVNPKKAVEI